ncbi:MAG: OadG family protein [Prolixibacteraceae bacterium]|jgi:oxaloacetate decarboxylase gamma subunit|nr:OadG family protein [Prolixibacteraceae bacterium]
MNGNFEIALQLLGIGMLTVFLILFLVVFLGNIIIRFVNRFIPPVETKTSRTNVVQPAISTGKMAAIVAAVQAVTEGKGKVVNV